MIGSLRGTLATIQGPTMLIDVGGVGYEVHASRACREAFTVGEPCSIVVYTDVRQDGIRLFGFVDQLERQAFSLLMLVKGVGAKTASEILSAIDKRELLRAVASGDLQRLQTTRGIGKKTAERIIVELRDKVAEYALEGAGQFGAVPGHDSDLGAMRDAEEALRALGFVADDIQRALAAVRAEGSALRDSGEVVRAALRFV